MRKRDLLKAIGVASATSGFSLTAQAGDLTAESRDTTRAETEKYIQTKPVQNISEKIGTGFNIRKRNNENKSGKINLDEQAEESRVKYGGETIAHGIRYETNVGILGLVIQNGTVVQAILAVKKKSNKGWIKKITNAPPAKGKSQFIIGTPDTAMYARTATGDEEALVAKIVGGEVSNVSVIENESNIYYKGKTDSSVVIIDRSTEEILHEKQIGASVSSSDGFSTMAAKTPDSCKGAPFHVCAYDLMDSSFYCGLAGEACVITGLGGPAPFVACLAAIASLCGGRVMLMKISGACEEVAECIVDYCDQSIAPCGPSTPIYPVA
ncbi:hypothetical protein [Halopelagius fulvigenes]|uniref:Uncharacterized protein n=1 Tax=Halopelagius fulvigenes TaxID=1198324 RepID=A0ABD5TSW8_9EURY